MTRSSFGRRASRGFRARLARASYDLHAKAVAASPLENGAIITPLISTMAIENEAHADV